MRQVNKIGLSRILVAPGFARPVTFSCVLRVAQDGLPEDGLPEDGLPEDTRFLRQSLLANSRIHPSPPVRIHCALKSMAWSVEPDQYIGYPV